MITSQTFAWNVTVTKLIGVAARLSFQLINIYEVQLFKYWLTIVSQSVILLK